MSSATTSGAARRSWAQAAYRSPALGWFRPAWRASKRAWYGSVNTFLGGRRHRFGPAAVRVPAEYSHLWRTRSAAYEEAAAARVVAWCRANPTGVFLDVGSEIGQYSTAALTTLHGGDVYAFDSALSSLLVLARSRWVGASANRLTLVHGFVTDAGQGKSIDDAARETRARLSGLGYTDWVSLDYVNLDGASVPDVPHNSLDDLFRDAPVGRPWFLKMDIEGAEAVALRGATAVMARHRPRMLISVHPPLLGGFGSSREQILDFIRAQGYAIELVCQDHEEHWWCDPV